LRAELLTGEIFDTVLEGAIQTELSGTARAGRFSFEPPAVTWDRKRYPPHCKTAGDVASSSSSSSSLTAGVGRFEDEDEKDYEDELSAAAR